MQHLGASASNGIFIQQGHRSTRDTSEATGTAGQCTHRNSAQKAKGAFLRAKPKDGSQVRHTARRTGHATVSRLLHRHRTAYRSHPGRTGPQRRRISSMSSSRPSRLHHRAGRPELSISVSCGIQVQGTCGKSLLLAPSARCTEWSRNTQLLIGMQRIPHKRQQACSLTMHSMPSTGSNPRGRELWQETPTGDMVIQSRNVESKCSGRR